MIEFIQVSQKLAHAGKTDAWALREVSLQVKAGELLAILGPTGSGKTTLLRLAAGLDKATSGEIRVGGLPPGNRSTLPGEPAMVFQNQALFPHLTVHENLALGLELRGLEPERMPDRIGQMAGFLELEPLMNRRPSELSGGERQRVAIGRALLRPSGLLLLDEPLNSLDSIWRHRLRLELVRWHGQSGATILYVTHDQEEALAVADRLVVMNAGRIQQTGIPQAVYARPANLFVATFIGTPPINLFRGQLVECNGVCGLSMPSHDAPLLLTKLDPAPLKSWFGRPLVVGLRSENIRVACLPQAADPNAVDCGTVEMRRLVGPFAEVHLRFRSQTVIGRLPATPRFEVGQALRLEFDWAAACCFDPESGKAIV